MTNSDMGVHGRESAMKSTLPNSPHHQRYTHPRPDVGTAEMLPILPSSKSKSKVLVNSLDELSIGSTKMQGEDGNSD